MLNRALLPAFLSLLLLPSCQQQRLDHCIVEDPRFRSYEQPELQVTYGKLSVLMAEREPSCEQEADDLAEASQLVLGKGPAAFLEQDELEEAEEAYLELRKDLRVTIASNAMHELLSTPTRNIAGQQLCSMDALNVRSLMQDAGEYFAPCEDQCIAATREILFKRMLTRMILEDVACNPLLETEHRCAAVICLRHIFLEAMLGSNGAWNRFYLIDALQLDRRNSELERAIFGTSPL